MCRRFRESSASTAIVSDTDIEVVCLRGQPKRSHVSPQGSNFDGDRSLKGWGGYTCGVIFFRALNVHRFNVYWNATGSYIVGAPQTRPPYGPPRSACDVPPV